MLLKKFPINKDKNLKFVLFFKGWFRSFKLVKIIPLWNLFQQKIRQSWIYNTCVVMIGRHLLVFENWQKLFEFLLGCCCSIVTKCSDFDFPVLSQRKKKGIPQWLTWWEFISIGECVMRTHVILFCSFHNFWICCRTSLIIIFTVLIT